MKSTKIAGLVLAGTAATGMIFAGSVAAQATTEDGSTTFIQRLAEKLGIAESDVETAVTAIREENQAERQAERAENIAEAIEAGDLTERQAEILNALEDIKSELEFEKPDREEFADLTQEERQALMEQHREERQTQVLEALNEAGLDVTADELDALHEQMRELGLGGRGEKGGHGGPRGMMQ